MPKRSMNPIDAHVGARVRLRRMLVGMSQEKLGEMLGVTFQQVQKYEKGANRIGASRLFEVSQFWRFPFSISSTTCRARARGPSRGLRLSRTIRKSRLSWILWSARKALR